MYSFLLHFPNKYREECTNQPTVVTLRWGKSRENAWNVYQKMAPTERTASLLVLKEPCSIMFFNVLFQISTIYWHVHILIPFLSLDMCLLGSCCGIVSLHVRYCCTDGIRQFCLPSRPQPSRRQSCDRGISCLLDAHHRGHTQQVMWLEVSCLWTCFVENTLTVTNHNCFM
jgi:hypothetical protein